MIQTPSVMLICEQCGHEFARYLHYHRHLVEKKGITRTFCSRQCKSDSQRIALPDDIAVRYVDGMETMAEIARSLGVSAELVRRRLLKMGVTIRSRGAHMVTDKNPTKGKGHSAIAREKIRAATILQFSDPLARARAAANQCKAMAAGKVPSVSRLEDMVAIELDRLGITYRRQYLIRDPDTGRFCACLDFFLADGSALEVNGGYWHADPRLFPDGPVYASQLRTVRQYTKKRAALKKLGIPLREVWEIELRQDATAAVKAAVL